MKKVDIDSEEFKSNLEKTIKFTDKVVKQFNWVYNPDEYINEGIQLGLTRNKMLYNKRFCPCFMVEPDGYKFRSVEDRICPCKPAIEKEIPEKGICHCQIFCTPEYAKKLEEDKSLEEATHTHNRCLTKEETERLLNNESIDGEELLSLLESRDAKCSEFKLVDVREQMEYNMTNIKGTDILLSTTNFYSLLDEALEKGDISKDIPMVIYCQSGSRSDYVCTVLRDRGFKAVNLRHGIAMYHGAKN